METDSEIIMDKIFDIQSIRKDFPILHREVYGKPLIYLDNAATTQKPQVVIDAISHFYTNENSNIHRGVHHLSELATMEYESTRSLIQNFIHAKTEKEIIFTRGTTESINLVANSYCKPNLKEGDEVLISTMEHHSNIVPWQMICAEKKAKLVVAPINDAGEIIVEEFNKLLNEKTKMVSLVYVSNSLGTVNPIDELIRLAKKRNIPVMIDGAQAVQHFAIDVQAMDCDFFAFSSHKLYGPTGVGVLYGKQDLLEAMPPYQGGGDMILSVTFDKTTYNGLPHKFEAGTPNIAGVIGLGAAINYVDKLGLSQIAEYEHDLLAYAEKRLSEIDGVRLIGTAKNKVSVASFVIENIHPHDIGTILDREGIAIRTGHHCTQPVMQRFGIPATSRASFSFYNTKEEVDALELGIHKVIKMFN